MQLSKLDYWGVVKIGLSAADNVMSERIYRSKIIHEEECKADKTQFHQSQTLFCLVGAFSNGGDEMQRHEAR